jgi:hypothetical protein
VLDLNYALKCIFEKPFEWVFSLILINNEEAATASSLGQMGGLSANPIIFEHKRTHICRFSSIVLCESSLVEQNAPNKGFHQVNAIKYTLIIVK